jgi:YD repeat-containing protein
MRTISLLLFTIITIYFLSCQKELDIIDMAGNGDTDSTNNKLLIKTVAYYNLNNDSIVTNYHYNAKGNLIKQSNNDGSVTGEIDYQRDDKERIIKIVNTASSGVSLVTEVYYSNETTGNVAYSVTYNTSDINKRIDSTVYNYENNKLSKTTLYTPWADTMSASYYYNLNYDVKGNVIQVRGFSINSDGTSSFNIGYDYLCDSYLNPFYSHDDIRNIYNWGNGSPNNITKLVHHYNTTSSNDDYVNSEYQYDEKGRPVKVALSGPFTVTNTMYYYYQ